MDTEHAEGILRGVVARPDLYVSTAPAAATVLAALDATAGYCLQRPDAGC